MGKRGLTHLDVSHNEGRQHKTTGLNPLDACKQSASARNEFLAVVQAWTPVFERALCKRYSVLASDLLELRKAALGKVPFLFKDGKVHHWSRYSVMGATRSCDLLFQTLGRSPTMLTPELYDVLKKDQANDDFDEEGECSDDENLTRAQTMRVGRIIPWPLDGCSTSSSSDPGIHCHEGRRHF